MRPTGVVSKKVTGARTSAVSEKRWMMREARSADSRLQAERSVVISVKAAGGGGHSEEMKGRG